MSKEVKVTKALLSKVRYDTDLSKTALVTVDVQVGFGEGFEPVPHAHAAVENIRRACQAWRAAGGTVIHIHTYYTPDKGPDGRMEDFVPGLAEGLAKDAPATAFYDGLVSPGDILVRKTAFSAVMSSDLVEQLRRRGFDTAVVCGLTTPICVQTTVDGLSQTGTKVILLADGCASQPMGNVSAEDAHDMAVTRMAYLFAEVTTTADFIARAAVEPREQRIRAAAE